MIQNSYHLLKTLLEIVDKDDDSIWIDWENKQFCKVHDSATPEVIRAFPSNEPSLSGLLLLLEDEGYIKMYENQEYCSLTYKAFYYKQLKSQERLQYFLKSVCIPIIISLVTSVICNLALPLLLELIQGYIASMG